MIHCSNELVPSLLSNLRSDKTASTHLHTRVISNFDVFDERSTSHNHTSTFVSTDEGKFSCQWPVTVNCVEICVTDTGVFDVDENFVWSRLLDWNLLVYNS